MKAIVITAQGGPEVLQLQEVPAPEPKAGEVLVDIEAVGLNFADVLAAKGRYAGGPKPPYVGGREFAGTRADNGQRVMGYVEYGAFAEQIAVPEDRIWPIPEGWTAADAAAFPVNYFTAYLLYWKASLLPGETRRPSTRAPRALIHAAAGGVGTAAVQIGKLLGIETYGTSSSDEKLQRVAELGLNHGINYTREDYEQAIEALTRGEGVDTVFDMLGGDDTAKSIRTLAFDGRCIIYGAVSGKRPQFDIGALYAKACSVHGLWLSRLVYNRELMNSAWTTLHGWIREGSLKPVVGDVVPLDRLADAFQLVLERKNFGKIVLTVKA